MTKNNFYSLPRLAFSNYVIFFKQNFKRIKSPNKWVALEGGIDFTQRSLRFWGSLECEWDLLIPNRTYTHSHEWVKGLSNWVWVECTWSGRREYSRLNLTLKKKIYLTYPLLERLKKIPTYLPTPETFE